MAKRQQSVPRPLKRVEYELRFATREAEKGWTDLLATARNAVVDAWDFLTRTPDDRSSRCHPLKGDLETLEPPQLTNAGGADHQPGRPTGTTEPNPTRDPPHTGTVAHPRAEPWLTQPRNTGPHRAQYPQAAMLGIPATTLMRQWVIEKATTPATNAVVSVAEPERFIAEHNRPMPSTSRPAPV